MIHNISRFIAALALLATAQGAWAQTPSGNWDTWVNDNNIDWNSADAKAAAIPQSDDGSTVYISTAEQLAYYAYAVNNDKQISGSASGYYCGRTVELMADIDLSEHYWKPIGWNKDYYFSGYFHGNGHVITGIHVNGDPKSDNTNYYPCYGLFGYFHTRSSGTSTITDLVLKDFSITASFSGNNSAEFYLGGLVGRCDDNTAITNCLLVNGSVSKSGNNSWAHIGKVSGAGSPSAATANYYHNVSVSGWYSGYDSYALQTIGGETEARAVALTISSTHGSVALGGTVGRISGGIIYAPANETVTLNTTTDAGYIASLAATGLTLTSGQFTMPDNDDATITATVSIDPAHFSQDGDTYTINTAGGWNVFCDLLESGESFSGKTVQLGDDITVTRMAGGSGHEFTGTFDGGGHTLTFNYANTDNNTRTAPFSYVDGATIQNLIVGGTISGTAYRAAGIIGETGNTTSHITNCVSSVDISSGRYTGGFSIGGNVEIEGCVFNGKIKGTTYSGGFIGYSYSAQVIKNSLFAPQDGSSISGGTFYYNGGGDVAPVNSYYTQALGTAQGKACHSVTAGTDVTIDTIALTGTATQYTVSGITAYSGGGLQRGQTLYYGSDDQLILTLTTSAQCDQPGYQYAYTASAGTLSGTTLTMPDEDVTISATLATIDWATVNQGNSADPYMIYNKDQLLLLAHRVNGTNGETANEYSGKLFKLGADITFTYDADEGDDYDENYEAIGGYYNSTYRYFKGDFDGDGHTVSGIRIRKDGSGTADIYQGLFGCISSGAGIYDVHLTDARIKGCQSVGGIVGYNVAGYIWRCSVTDSYITATGNANYGTICGRSDDTYRLRNNYYHGCTVNGTTVTSGKGCEGADITANHGALPAYRLALGANITTPPGTFAGQTEWLTTPPVNPRLAPENGFTLAGNHYFASGYVFTPGSTLASGAAQGYTPRATLGGQLLDLYTPTGDAPDYTGTAIARLSITADCDGKTLDAALRSDGQQHEVSYMTADGTTQTAQAVALDGHETRTTKYGNLYVDLAAGWYYVGTDIDYTGITLSPQGNITLILADGCTMHIGTAENRTGVTGIGNATCDLTIYGQSLDAATAGTISYEGTGSNGFNVGNYTQESGNVSISNSLYTGGIGLYAESVTLNGGKLSVATNSKYAIAIETSEGDITINGGQLDATATGSGDIYGLYADGTNCNITLGWTRPADRITASSISTNYGGTVAVKDGQALTDGSGNIYTGTLTASVLSGFAAETTLQPCLALADAADNTAAITDHAGQRLAVALSGRTLYKDGSWNTLCLPFAVDLTASGTLSGDNVKAMTLNTTSSNLTDGTLTLNFDAATETIPAGTPFIIKWDKSSTDITNPVFYGVTIDADKHDATVTDVLTFTGTYVPVTIPDDGDNTKLYLGSANTLYYPTKAMTIGCHRAYFQLADGITAGEPTSSSNAQQIHAFNLNFGDDEATGIVSAEANSSLSTLHSSLSEWYTLDGVKLAAKPTAKGLYIHGGKKVAIK